MRRISLVRWTALVSVVAASMAFAVRSPAQLVPRRISGGSAQFYVGNGLPIPHVSFGGARQTPYAFVLTSNNGQTLVQPPARFLHNDFGLNQPALFNNAFVFQVYTNLSLRVPRVSQYASFVAGGRTGGDVYVWCPGQTGFGGSGNPICSLTPTALSVTVPACNTPGDCPNTTGSTQMLNVGDLGWARYSRTASQIGGPARSNTGGTFDVALNVASAVYSLPAEVAFVAGPPNPTGGIGGAFGSLNQHAVSPQTGVVVSHFTVGGSLTGLVLVSGLTGQCAALDPQNPMCRNNTTASFGLPFTAGVLSLSAPAAGEMFVLTGSDSRNADGSGNVTLVSGAVSHRTLSGPNANRGVLTFQVPEPTWIAGLAGALLALGAIHRLACGRPR